MEENSLRNYIWWRECDIYDLQSRDFGGDYLEATNKEIMAFANKGIDVVLESIMILCPLWCHPYVYVAFRNWRCFPRFSIRSVAFDDFPG